MSVSELYKIIVNEVTFGDFRGCDPPYPPMDPPLLL